MHSKICCTVFVHQSICFSKRANQKYLIVIIIDNSLENVFILPTHKNIYNKKLQNHTINFLGQSTFKRHTIGFTKGHISVFKFIFKTFFSLNILTVNVETLLHLTLTRAGVWSSPLHTPCLQSLSLAVTDSEQLSRTQITEPSHLTKHCLFGSSQRISRTLITLSCPQRRDFLDHSFGSGWPPKFQANK